MVPIAAVVPDDSHELVDARAVLVRGHVQVEAQRAEVLASVVDHAGIAAGVVPGHPQFRIQ